MAASVKIYLKNKKNPDGSLREDEVSILAKFTVSKENRFEVRVGEKIKPRHWNDEAQEAKRSAFDHVRLNRKLAELRMRLLVMYEENAKIPFHQFKALAQGTEEKKSQIQVALDEFLQQYSRDRDRKTVAVYNSFKRIFEPFLDLHFKDLNTNFFDRFREEMAHLHPTTQHNYLACLQCFLNWARKRYDGVDMVFKEWNIPPRSKDPIHLSLTELTRLSSAMLTGLAAIGRDYFCFEAYCGQRIGDIEAFNKKDLNGTVWTFNRKKGRRRKARQVIVNFEGFCAPALSIIKKYDYQLPKISRPTLAKYLRQAGEAAGIENWEQMTTHVARKTFINLAMDYGFTSDEVMDMVGIDTHAVFVKYYRGKPDQTIRRQKLHDMERQIKDSKQKADENMKAV